MGGSPRIPQGPARTIGGDNALRRTEAAITTRVLLVDDHTLMRQVLEMVVDAEPDLSVVGSAADASLALAIVPDVAPDIVLMDLELPGMDGIEATRRLAREHPMVRVVMLSASCTQSGVADALGAGAWGYLLKEGAPEELLGGIREVVSGHRSLAANARAVLEA